MKLILVFTNTKCTYIIMFINIEMCIIKVFVNTGNEVHICQM